MDIFWEAIACMDVDKTKRKKLASLSRNSNLIEGMRQ